MTNRICQLNEKKMMVITNAILDVAPEFDSICALLVAAVGMLDEDQQKDLISQTITLNKYIHATIKDVRAKDEKAFIEDRERIL